MLNSKQLIEMTGISRATLNNYVALGILPSPVVKTPEAGEGRTTRLGYFPDEALSRIQQVQKMKKDGLSIAAIAKQLAPPHRNQYPLSEHRPQPQSVPAPSKASQGREPLSNLSLELTVDNFPGPAYMVNNNFELIWWNDQAVNTIFQRQDSEMPGDVVSRNLLSLLFHAYRELDEDNLIDTLRPHLEAAKKRLTHQTLIKIYSSLNGEDLGLIESLYSNAESLGKDPIVHYPINLLTAEGNCVPCDLYVCFYREGILFTYSPIAEDSDYLLNFLAQRNQVIRELLRKRKPYLSHVAVMVADLQHSVRICSELPAEEYFELINYIWQESEPIFRKYYGTYGKHAGDGMVYYFFPQPDCDYIFNAIQCALELREMMRKLSAQWQARKGWFNELLLNIGLNEGQEWFGTFHAGAHVEFAVLGETINHAARISDFAHGGSIWITKTMLNQIPKDQRHRIHFGIPRKLGDDETIFVNDTYASVGNLLDHNPCANSKLRDVEMVAITQIRGIIQQE
ncbi:MAG: hypothetical protein RLZZ385_2466 [Pseudomonadota bacterium]|jgi:class 3 adenylate cyclase/DNA-binding transcriptional MerR regulator